MEVAQKVSKKEFGFGIVLDYELVRCSAVLLAHRTRTLRTLCMSRASGYRRAWGQADM